MSPAESGTRLSGHSIAGAIILFFLSSAAPSGATIITSGNLTGGGTPYNGTDDPWAVSNLRVGDTAPGSMAITGGSDVNDSGSSRIANSAAASTSTVTVSGAGSTWKNSSDLTVGVGGGTGTLNITGGGTVSTNFGGIGNGSVTVDGATSTWTMTSWLSVGNSATGRLMITGGGAVSNTGAWFGSFSGDGTVTVDGAGSTWTNFGTLTVGSSGTGKLIVTGGATVSNTEATIGAGSTSNGTVAIDGAGSTWTNSSSLIVGSGGGTGTLNITGGGTVSTNFGGIDNGSSVTVDGPGSTWSSSGRLGIYGGTLNIKSGGLVITPDLDDSSATASINLDGGTLRITANDSAANRINLLAGGGSFDVPNAARSFTINSGISGVGGLIKTSAGTLILQQANGYTGNTTVSDGTLRLTGVGSIASSPLISVGTGAKFDMSSVTGGANHDGVRFALLSGQTLKGTGTVFGVMDISSGATVTPGNSVGTLLTSSLTFAAGSTLGIEIDLGGTHGADLLDVSGNIRLGGATLNLSLFNASPLMSPRTYLIALNDTGEPIMGTFGAITGLPSNWSATVNYAYSGTDFLGRVGTGNDLAVTVVPEPNAVVLLGIGLVALLAMRKTSQIPTRP